MCNTTSVPLYIFSQTIRETWGNSSAFNIKQFAVIHHSALKPKHLNVNYSDWKAYAKNDDNVTSAYSSDFRVETIFLVGQTISNEIQAKIIEESQSHQDIIQESFLDSYNNLTVKTIMMLKWVNDNCADKGKIQFICPNIVSINHLESRFYPPPSKIRYEKR